MINRHHSLIAQSCTIYSPSHLVQRTAFRMPDQMQSPAAKQECNLPKRLLCTSEHRLLSLPVANTEVGSCKHKSEYYGAQVQGNLQPVDPVLKVLQWVPVQLYQLYCKLQECSCNGEGSTNKEESVLTNGQI